MKPLMHAGAMDDTIEASIERYRAAVPERLQALAVWLVWRFESAEKAGEKARKVPYYANGRIRRGVQGAPDDLAQLVSFDAALDALRSGRWSGLGVAHVPGCGLNSWDFDNCIDAQGAIAPDLSELLYAADTYVEVSPSGRGVRMVALGRLPSVKRIHPGGYNIELFGESGFVTITGHTLAGDDVRPLPDKVEQTLRSWLQADLSEQPHTRTDQLAAARAADPVYQHMKAAGAIKRDWPDGRSSITCPFEAEHTSGAGRSDTVYFLPHTNGYASGHFRCLHAHCAQRSDAEYRAALGVHEVDFSGLLNPKQPDDTPLLLDYESLQRAVGPMSWLVKGLIPANAMGSAYGASSTFKSFIILDGCLHIAHGLPWLGRKTKGGGVVYVAAEGGNGLLARVDAWHQHHQRDPKSARFRACISSLTLDRQADLKRLSDALQDEAERIGGIYLVVLDTMSQTMSGDENEARDTAGYMRAIGAWIRARFSCAVLIVHHTGKDASRGPRGSSTIRGNLDFLFDIERVEGAMVASLTVRKQKDGRDGDSFTFDLARHVIGKDEDGDELTSLVATHHDAVEAIVATSSSRASKYEMWLLEVIGTGRLYADARDAFYKKCGDDKPDTKKKAFSRTIKTLIESGYVIEKGNCLFKRNDDG